MPRCGAACQWYGKERTAMYQAVWEAAVQNLKDQTKIKQAFKKTTALASVKNPGQ